MGPSYSAAGAQGVFADVSRTVRPLGAIRALDLDRLTDEAILSADVQFVTDEGVCRK